MKVLQLCHKPPFPPVDGGCIAMNNITNGLIRHGIKVKVLTANTFKHPLNIEMLPETYRKTTNIETVFIDTQINFKDALLNLFSSEPYNVTRFFSDEFDAKIAETLQKEKFDVVHLESLFVTPYLNTIRKNSNAKIILRAHNVEFEIWEERAKTENNFLKKMYLKNLLNKLKKYEISLLNKYDGIAAITGNDAQTFRSCGCKIPIETILFGIDFSEYESAGDQNNLFFLGAMDWLPNVQGIEWFLSDVWKIVSEKNPELKLVLAGRKMKLYKAKNVETSGEVADAKKFMLSNGIMIVPLFSGSGVRVKIIEAMALGKVIVATPVAVKGIPCEHKKNILVASGASEFAEMIQVALSDSTLRKNISENAKQFIGENYDNNMVIEKLIAFYNQLG